MKKKQNGSGITASKQSQSKTRTDIIQVPVEEPLPLPVEEPLGFQDLPLDVQEIILNKGLQQNKTLSYTEALQVMVRNNPNIKQDEMKDLLAPEYITITSTSLITPEYIQVNNSSGVPLPLYKLQFKKVSDYTNHINKLQDNDINKMDSILFEGRNLSVTVYLHTPANNKGYIEIRVKDNSLQKMSVCSLVLAYMYFKGKPLHIAVNKIMLSMYLSDNIITNDEGVIDISNTLDMVVSTLWLRYIFKTISWVNTMEFNEIDNINIKFIQQGVSHPIDVAKFNKEYPNSELVPNLQKLLKTIKEKLLTYYPKKIVRQTRSTITAA